MTDPIVDAVCAKLQSRSAVGLKKYGTTLADNPATVKEKLIHIQEELMDGANYIEWLLQEEKMPTPMTIEMEVTKTPENVTCGNLSNADGRQDKWSAFYKYVESETDDGEMLIDGWVAAEDVETIRSALQSPRVPVIEGLDNALRIRKELTRKEIEPDGDYVVWGFDVSDGRDKSALVRRCGNKLLDIRSWGGGAEDLGDSEEWYPVNEFDMAIIYDAARAYAELQKGN